MENLRPHTPDEQPHILTIDVEDWYLAHLEFFGDSPVAMDARPDPAIVGSVKDCLALLDETKNSATFFVLGSVAEHYPEIVKTIIDRGHEVASHGYHHRRLMNLTPEEFEADLCRSVDVLTRAGADKIKGYRAPCFSITRKTLWALDIIKKCGLVYDSSIFPIWRRLYGIPRWPREPMLLDNGLREYPPATVRKLGLNFPVAGGGYLRMLPYSFVAEGMRMRSLSIPGVFYLHPYELDPGTAVMRHRPRRLYSRAVAWLERRGMGGSPGKIRRLLRDFRFTRLDWYLR